MCFRRQRRRNRRIRTIRETEPATASSRITDNLIVPATMESSFPTDSATKGIPGLLDDIAVTPTHSGITGWSVELEKHPSDISRTRLRQCPNAHRQ